MSLRGIGLTLILAFALAFLGASAVQAHRSGCHRWHSCPSDTGSYVCGTPATARNVRTTGTANSGSRAGRQSGTTRRSRASRQSSQSGLRQGQTHHGLVKVSCGWESAATLPLLSDGTVICPRDHPQPFPAGSPASRPKSYVVTSEVTSQVAVTVVTASVRETREPWDVPDPAV